MTIREAKKIFTQSVLINEMISAISKDDAKKVEKTLNLGVMPNGYHGNQNKTFLILASIAGSLDCMKVLISKGANIYGKDTAFRNSLHHASMNGHVDCIDYLLDLDEKMVSEIGVSLQSPGVSKYIDSKDKFKITPISLAASFCRINVIQRLLEKGADHLIEDTSGRNAIDSARSMGKHDSVTTIISTLATIQVRQGINQKLSANPVITQNQLESSTAPGRKPKREIY